MIRQIPILTTRIIRLISIYFVKFRIFKLISIRFVKFRIFILISIRFINFRVNTSASIHIIWKLKILHYAFYDYSILISLLNSFFKKEDWKLFFRPTTEQQFVEFAKMLPCDWLGKFCSDMFRYFIGFCRCKVSILLGECWSTRKDKWSHKLPVNFFVESHHSEGQILPSEVQKIDGIEIPPLILDDRAYSIRSQTRKPYDIIHTKKRYIIIG